MGHGTATSRAFLDLLHAAGVKQVVDVRSLPASRHNPQFARSELQEWLPAGGLQYHWEADLGGFRRVRPDSPHLGLRHPSFRGYADYMATVSFLGAVERLLQMLPDGTTAIMCAESLWWRCHRRLIADHLVLTRAIQVFHLDHRGGLSPHRLTLGVTLEDGSLIYRLPPAGDPRAAMERIAAI